MSLFDASPVDSSSDAKRPLAERMRPERLEDFVGQDHILGPGKPLRAQIERDQLSSLILWGPPGVGKTTLARLIARITKADYVPFSAVLAGIKEIKAVMADAERSRRAGRRTVLFIDEIHRFNKAQQDAFLPYVERGDIILIGATTENPSFEVVSALLSRAKVYALRALSVDEIVLLLERALHYLELSATRDLLEQIAIYSNGDARSAYNVLELASAVAREGVIERDAIESVIERKTVLYDKAGEEHFNLISALHKSIRSSRMRTRRCTGWRGCSKAERTGCTSRGGWCGWLSRTSAWLIHGRWSSAWRCSRRCIFWDPGEGDLALAQAAIYLAVAPKSDAAYRALNAAMEAVKTSMAAPVPMQLRNAPTRAMKEWGYSAGYQHAHKFEDALNTMECLPDNLRGTVFYEPTDRGVEKRIAERLAEIRKKKS